MSVTERRREVPSEYRGFSRGILSEYPEVVRRNGESNVILGFVDIQVTQDTARKEELADIVTRMRCFGIPMGVYSDSSDTSSAITQASELGANGFVITEAGKKVVTIFEQEHTLNEGVASSLDFPDGLPNPKIGDDHAFAYLSHEIGAFYPSAEVSGIIPILITGEKSVHSDHEFNSYGGRSFCLSENTLTEIGAWINETADSESGE